MLYIAYTMIAGTSSTIYHYWWIPVLVASAIVLILLALFYIPQRFPRFRSFLRKIPVISRVRTSSQRISLEKSLEFTGFAFNPRQDVFYSVMDAWQKPFGYCWLYDEAAAPLSMIIDCEPIRFEYEKKHWLIEFWKGQYGMTTGCEVGIYYTDGPDLNIPGIFSGTFYQNIDDADQLDVSYSLFKNRKLLFTRKDRHWWLTGFKLGEFSEPDELTADISITLKNGAMCDAFIKALHNAGYAYQEMSVKNYTVSFTFNRPRASQPLTRTTMTDWIAQRRNERLCKEYQNMTRGYETTPEKLQAIQKLSPKMYEQLIHIGRPKQLYEVFNALEGYIHK